MLDEGAVLRSATDRAGHRPLPWVAGPLDGSSLVLDLCCGEGALADELPTGHWLGIDEATRTGKTPLLRAVPTALPVGDSSVDAIAMLLALPRLPDLDGVFAELRRALRPGGTLVLLVPSAVHRSARELRLSAVLAEVHRHWLNRSALDRVGWLLAAADFAVLGDDRLSFSLPMPDADAAAELVEALPRAGLWPRDLPADLRARVLASLSRVAGPGRVLPVPMRRVVARR